MTQIHFTTFLLRNVLMGARELRSLGLIHNYWANLQSCFWSWIFVSHGHHLRREVSTWVPFCSLVIMVCHQLNVQNNSTSLDCFWWEINQLHKLLSKLIFNINILWGLEILVRQKHNTAKHFNQHIRYSGKTNLRESVNETNSLNSNVQNPI